MLRHNFFSHPITAAAICAVLLFDPAIASAHCDGLDGPVVKAARQALDSGDVKAVLIWVQKTDEAEIQHAFQKTLQLRKLGATAKGVADHYFFETLVRVHRSGEGAPYTGLKPAGRDLGPAIPAGDKALETGSIEPLIKLLTGAVEKGLREQFKAVMSGKNFTRDDISAGREHVKAYVEYIHYVERLYEATLDPAKGHFPEHAVPVHND